MKLLYKLNNNILMLRKRKFILSLLGASTLLLIIILNIINQPLTNNVTPSGIISFELAKSLSNSELILTSWNQTEKEYAALSLGLDYLFMLAYSFFLFYSILFLLNNFKNKNQLLFRFGFYLAWAQLLAAIFDGLENYFLIQLLFGAQSELFSQLSFYFASMKFTIIALGILFIVIGLVLQNTSIKNKRNNN